MKLPNYRELIKDRRIFYYIERADHFLESMGYTYHGIKHVAWVAGKAYRLMKTLGYSERQAQVAAVAGLLHDIGNIVSRHDHAQASAVMAYDLLKGKGFSDDELTEIMYAIGNHESDTGVPATPASAALVIADKSHVHRNRVRSPSNLKEDIHDRVNYSVYYANIVVSKKEKVIRLVLKIDTSISDILEFFSIFQPRMIMCRNASKVFGYSFKLKINGTNL